MKKRVSCQIATAKYVGYYDKLVYVGYYDKLVYILRYCVIYVII